MNTKNLLTRMKYPEIVTIFLAFLFLYAASSKLMEYDLFQAQLGKSPMITDYAKFLAWFVPTSEIVISICLFVPNARLFGLYASFSLMYAFTAYIAIMLLFSPYVPCSCGGILSHMEWTDHLVFNIVVTLVTISTIVLQIKAENKAKEIPQQQHTTSHS